MKKRKYVRNMTRLRRTQGCLTDCVAYFLNLHPENVPYFVYPREGWNERLKAFFKRHGYEVRWNYCTNDPVQNKINSKYALPKNGTHIIAGNSLRYKTYGHVVVYKKGKLAYDPNFPSDWSDKRITHRLIVQKKPHAMK